MKSSFPLLIALGSFASAADPDPDLPQPFDHAVVAAMITNSPFNRSVNLSDSLILSGLAYIDGKPVATIINSETGRSYIVREEPNVQGWKLAEASPTTDLARAQVKVAIGGEIFTIRYNADALKPENLKKKREKSPGNGPPPGGPPGGDDRFRRSSSRGPSEEERARYESLSDNAKEKMRNFFRDNLDRLRNAGSDEERRQFVRSAFEKIESEDKKNRK